MMSVGRHGALRGRTSSSSGFARLLLAFALAAPGVGAQIADQVVVFGPQAYKFARFDRKLGLLGLTNTPTTGSLGGLLGTSVDAQGRYSIPYDALADTKVLHLQANGTLLPSSILQHNPNKLVTLQSGITHVLTRIPLSSSGPLYALSGSGAVLWSNPAAPSLFKFYPQKIVVKPSGEVWIGGAGPGRLQGQELSLLVRADPVTGAVLDQKLLDKPTGFPGFSATIDGMAASPDDSLWVSIVGYMTHVVGTAVVAQVHYNGGWNGATNQLRVDAFGNPIAISGYNTAGAFGSKLLVFEAGSLELLREYQTGGAILGFALGPAGEDAYVSMVVESEPGFPRRLVRVNLVTNTKSSVGVGQWFAPPGNAEVPEGDPTGFIWANVTDQQGDSDGDGAANRAETLAGSDPLDATSRPEGPKVYLSFAPATNAIRLTWKDPDGLFDPAGGLSVPSISLTASGYGEVMQYLWPFITSVDIDPNGKEATIELGALPLPLGMKVALEARVADKTGATAWDWQVTPPGEL